MSTFNEYADEVCKAIDSLEASHERHKAEVAVLSCLRLPYNEMTFLFNLHVSELNTLHSSIERGMTVLNTALSKVRSIVVQNSTVINQNRGILEDINKKAIEMRQQIKDTEQSSRATQVDITAATTHQTDLETELTNIKKAKQDLLTNLNPKQVSFLLQESAKKGDMAMVELISTLNFDPNFQNEKQETLLHVVISMNNKELLYKGLVYQNTKILRHNNNLLQKILAKKPNLNLVDNEGNTPLKLAIIKEQIYVAKDLLEHGANPNILGHDCRTIEDLINHFNPKQVSSIFQEALKKGDVAMIRLINRLDFDADFQNEQKESLLHTVVSAGNERFFSTTSYREAYHLSESMRCYSCGPTVSAQLLHKVMLKCPNINVRDHDGNTPLHLAIIKSQLWAARALLANAFPVLNPDITNHDGQTAADLAKMAHYTDIVHSLDFIHAHNNPHVQDASLIGSDHTTQ